MVCKKFYHFQLMRMKVSVTSSVGGIGHRHNVHVLSLPPFYGVRIHYWAYQVENDQHMWDEATGQHHTHDIYSTYVEVANKADKKQIDLY